MVNIVVLLILIWFYPTEVYGESQARMCFVWETDLLWWLVMVLSTEVKVLTRYCWSRSNIPSCADCALHNSRGCCSRSGPFRLEWFPRCISSKIAWEEKWPFLIHTGASFGLLKRQVAATRVVCTLPAWGLTCAVLALVGLLFDPQPSLAWDAVCDPYWPQLS